MALSFIAFFYWKLVIIKYNMQKLDLTSSSNYVE